MPAKDSYTKTKSPLDRVAGNLYFCIEIIVITIFWNALSNHIEIFVNEESFLSIFSFFLFYFIGSAVVRSVFTHLYMIRINVSKVPLRDGLFLLEKIGTAAILSLWLLVVSAFVSVPLNETGMLILFFVVYFIGEYRDGVSRSMRTQK